MELVRNQQMFGNIGFGYVFHLQHVKIGEVGLPDDAIILFVCHSMSKLDVHYFLLDAP